MTYTPPDADNVDFEPEVYTPPAADNVDFDLQVVVRPAPVVLDLATSDPVIGADTLVQPSPVELQFEALDALVSANTIVRPDPAELSFDTPLTAGIQPFLLNDEWQLDEQPLRAATVEGSPRTLTLSFEADRSEIDQWRQFDQAGDLAVQDAFGGQFRAESRSDQSAVEVRPAFSEMRPFQPSKEYYVSGYSETQVAPDRFEVSVTLQRRTNRGQGFPTLSQTGAWEFDLEFGTLGLAESKASLAEREGSTSGSTVALSLRLSDEQLGAWFDSLGYPAGVTQRTVGDGADFRTDESPDQRQTITVAGPDGAALSDGSYYVVEWSLSKAGFGDRRWGIEVTLAPR